MRLQSSGRARRSPLWDQFHEGQRIRIITPNGAGPPSSPCAARILALSSGAEAIVRVDDLWVDVGARSRAEVAQLGIALLDPVIREWPPWRFADFVAGPAAGDRASCAAVAAAARCTPATGRDSLGDQRAARVRVRGLAAVLTAVGHADSLFLVDPVLARDTTVSCP